MVDMTDRGPGARGGRKLTMPRYSAKFKFEFKVFDWAMRFCHLMTGRIMDDSFSIILDADGATRRAFFGDPAEFGPEGDPYGQPAQSALFYNPIDAPEYYFMYWQNIRRETLERLMGEPFEEADFVSLSGRERMEFPPRWSVWF
jgi:hypothetical protein